MPNAKTLFITTVILCSNLYGEAIARLLKTEGKVTFKRLGSSIFNERATLGTAINNGDALRVGEQSFAAVMYLDDKTVLKIRENSEFEFLDTRNTRTIDMERGTILNEIESSIKYRTFRIETPISVASVKGTKFAALVDPSGVDQFIGKEGSVEVLNIVSQQVVNVGPGQKAVSNSVGSLMQSPALPGEYPPDPEIEPYEKELKPSERGKTKSPDSTEIEKPEKQIEETKSDTTPDEKTPESEPEQDVKPTESEEEPPAPDEEPSQPQKPFSMGLGIGSATIDGVLYNQLSLRPEIAFGKLGVGFDLVVYMDNEGNVRDDEWDIKNDPGLLLDKILYVRWGKKTDPFWAKWGSMEDVTLGYGGLLQNYSNMMEFPSVRRVGLNTGGNIGPVGGEIFMANLKDFSRGGTLTGIRMQYTVSEDLPITIGLNFVTDPNMFSGLKDSDDDTYPDVFDDFPDNKTMWNDTDADGIPDPHDGLDTSSWDIDADGDNIVDYFEGSTIDPVISLKATPFSLQDNTASATGLSFDIGYPVLQSDAFSISVYTEFNKLSFPAVISTDSSFIRKERSGTGISIPGIRSSIFGILNLSMEFRLINGSYVPQFFDQAYDLNRVLTSTMNDQTIIRTKDMFVFDDYNDSTSSMGLFGSAGLSLFNLIDFSASYANMKADTTELKSFSTYLNLNTENIPKVSKAMAYYQRNNEDNPFDFANPSENTILGYVLGYELSKGVSLIWDFRQFYRDDGTGTLVPIQQTTIETAFNF